MKEIKEWFINAPWGKIAMVSWGSPKGDKVLLVHGRQDSCATFIPLLELLPDDLYYVALDLPGHGKSDAFPISTALHRTHFLAPVDIVIKHLGWKSFTYIAHSMGAEIGLFYNAAHPGLIKKFIHLDLGLPLYRITAKTLPEYFKDYEKNYDNYQKINIDDRVYTKSSAVQSVRRARGLTPAQAEIVLSRNLQALPPHPSHSPHPSALKRDDEDELNNLPKFKFSWDKRLKSLSHQNLSHEQYVYLFTTNIPPTLWIAASDTTLLHKGTDTDKIVQQMQAKIKDFQYKIVEGTHDVHLTNPERIAGYVKEFLKYDFKKSKL